MPADARSVDALPPEASSGGARCAEVSLASASSADARCADTPPAPGSAGRVARCRTATVDLLAAPDASARRVSQCLFGERVDVLERTDGWYRVHNRRDGYRGYGRCVAFDDVRTDPADDGSPRTPRGTTSGWHACLVGVRATLLFARPDVKSPVRLRVPFGAELEVRPEDPGDGTGDRERPPREATSRFLRVRGAPGAAYGPDRRRDDEQDEAFVWCEHCLAPGETLEGTPVEIARRLFDGAPYLWGGRTPDGADCSGLVQGAAFALGVHLPRDSVEQERFLPRIVPWSERAPSDVVFWPGHVGLLLDPDTLFHATAHTLSTVLEPLASVIERAGAPSSIRRLPARAGADPTT